MSTKSSKKEERKRVPPITIENARIVFRNFSGSAKKFNAEGLRNFHVVIEPELAKVLEEDGWNVRWHDPKDDNDPPWASIKVAVKFDKYPPRIVMITGSNKTILNEDSVNILDWAEIKTVDLVLTPSFWEVDKKKGIKAYLQKMFVTLVEDDLESKYATVSKSATHSEDDGD